VSDSVQTPLCAAHHLTHCSRQQVAHLDVSPQRGATEGIGPIASASTDRRANRRERRLAEHR
jgi:hypothetical protein